MTVHVVGVAQAKSDLKGIESAEITEGSTLLSFLKSIGLSASHPYVYSVNGTIALMDTQLSDNDIVKIIPIVSGG